MEVEQMPLSQQRIMEAAKASAMMSSKNAPG
jgi:hypothetical protein